MAEDTLAAIMTRRLVTADADSDALTAIQRMVRADIGAVLVRRGKRVVGIITERDLLRMAAKGKSIVGKPVSAVMPRRKLITAKPEDPPLRALELMARHKVRRIPVARAGNVVGIVTERDVVKWLLRKPEVILDLLSPEYPAVSRDALVALLKEMQVRARV